MEIAGEFRPFKFMSQKLSMFNRMGQRKFYSRVTIFHMEIRYVYKLQMEQLLGINIP